MGRGGNKRGLGQKGQASVVIGMMMMTFILFFCFVVNTGMLVNAKINLQNAADLAAYAGAAVQARQLNQIGFLNYELRRAYKKFIFRYYVLGNMAQRNFPKTGGSGAYTFDPGGANSAGPIGVPVTCLIFNSADNFCQLSTLRKIQIPNRTGLDAINDTLVGQLEAIENIRQMNCQSIGRTNKQTLSFWLWNTDPTHEVLRNAPDVSQLSGAVMGITQGLGLVPKLIITKKRIDTLQYYVNFEAKTGLTLEAASALRNQGDVAARERTIQAFFSAYNTLGNHTFKDTESIIMDELLPRGSDGAALLTLRPVFVQFDTFAIDMALTVQDSCDSQTASSAEPTTNGQNCVSCPVPYIVNGNVPVAVVKDRSVFTYYAIRLSAKAAIMFSPFGDVKLKAYAAAQPFGSRIGPVVTANDFVTQRSPSNNTFCDPSNALVAQCTGKIPNLPVLQSDSTGSGWFNRAVLGNFYAPLSSGGGGLIGTGAISLAIDTATAPNPWERGKYNIPNDLSADPFVKYFDPVEGYSFWAPVVSPDKVAAGAQPDDELKAIAEQFTAGDGGGGTGSAPDMQKTKDFIVARMREYLAKLRQGAGEDGEGFNVARIMNPFKTGPTNNGATPGRAITGAPTMVMTAPDDIRTSWNAPKHGAYRALGRTGYSVKFVAFKTLMSHSNKTDGATDWTNTFELDGESEADMTAIQH